MAILRIQRIVFCVAFAAIVFSFNKVYAQLHTVSFAELDSLQKVEQRNVVVFIHTDWCKYCLQMKSTTFRNDSVVNVLNKLFYVIDLNAESKKVITYGGYEFKFKPTGSNTGIHELAEQLGMINGKLDFPTVSVLNAKNEIVFQNGGFLQTDELLAVLMALQKE
jgi:thioredoxin-related protein